MRLHRINILPAAIFLLLFFLQPAHSSIWYVNDSSTVGDAYTSAIGNDGNGGTTGAPFRTIIKAINTAAARDTIYVDAGIYDSYVVVSATEIAGINITKDSITLIGKDSVSTVVNPPGSNSGSGRYGIYADTQVGLLIKNLCITDAYYGIYFENVNQSIVYGDSISNNGMYGILLRGSDTNTISNNTVGSNSTRGIYLNSSSNNTVISNAVVSTGGIYLSWSPKNTVSNNTLNDNGLGIFLYGGCDTNTVNGNTVIGSGEGIILYSCYGNTVNGNTTSMGGGGIKLFPGANNNTVKNNSVSLNMFYGIKLEYTNASNTFIQNTLDSNVEYQIYIGGSSSTGTLQKNNIRTWWENPDSGVLNTTGNSFDFTRNYWYTTDSTAIRKKLYDTGGVNRITYQPYRLGPVDTALGADTVAPKSPSSVTVTINASEQIVLSWTNPTVDEEATVMSGFGGVRIYRSTTADTTDWAAGRVGQVGTTATSWTDTTAIAGTTYHYRLTSFDTWSVVNESWFSDTIVSTTATGGSSTPVASVHRGASTPPPQSVFGAVSNLPVLQAVITPKANGTLTSVKVTTGGTGNDVTGISASGVKLWQDWDGNGTGDTQLGSSGTFTTDNGYVTFSGLSVTLTKDKPLYLVTTYSFAGTATAGQTFYASISSASDIVGTSSGQSFTFDGLSLSSEAVTIGSASNNNPGIPTPSSPPDSATGIAPNGEIIITGYSDADGDTHKMTHWQVTDSTGIFDNSHMKVNAVIPTETGGLRFKFPRGLMKGNQKHYWRARFCDWRGGWSEWSTARAFTTAADTLAITPTANKTVDSNPYAKDTRPVNFKLKNGGDEKMTTMGAVKPEDEVTETGLRQKPSDNFKYGLFTFTCEGISLGGTITISLTMPENIPTTAKYFIFNVTVGWIDMTSCLSSMDGDSVVNLTLTDGGTGDLDGVANGIVVDPGGFEVSDASSSSSSSSSSSLSWPWNRTKTPESCVITRLSLSPYIVSAIRNIRDICINSPLGRKMANVFYRFGAEHNQ